MLHTIIFDEMDVIIQKDTSCFIINYLLSKMDSLNNVLIIGMTNRKKDMIDDAH